MKGFDDHLFRSLDLSRSSQFSRIASATVHLTLALIVIAIPPAAIVATEKHDRYTAVPLYAPPRVAMPAVVPPPIRSVVRMQSPPVKAFAPPPPVRVTMAQPKQIEAPDILANRAPEPKLEMPALPAPAPAPAARMASRAAVVTNTFEAGHSLSMQPAQAAHDVKLGAFDSSPVSGRPGGKGTSGITASAGFDAGTATGGSAGNRGARAVAPSGFGDYQSVAASSPVAVATPRVTPVEISFKPKPAYTPEARRKKIEGEVQLEVTFCATGQITVLRIVRGLDAGLDESARAAASQIRFQPATRDGVPVDVRGIVHIVFELS